MALFFQNRRAFTLTEIMVVVVAVSILAAFAIPSYTKTVERAHLRDAITQLTTIYSANQMYKAQGNGNFWPTIAGQDLAAINANLGLNILANGMTYTCGGDGTTFTCTAVRQAPANSFTVTVTQAVISAANPSCTAGACP